VFDSESESEEHGVSLLHLLAEVRDSSSPREYNYLYFSLYGQTNK